jgi:plastocyanin domain-containing protein
MAKSGQRSSHCMQAMQASASTTLTTKASIARTFVGQNSAQIEHPLQYRSIISISVLRLLIPFHLLLFYNHHVKHGFDLRRNNNIQNLEYARVF